MVTDIVVGEEDVALVEPGEARAPDHTAREHWDMLELCARVPRAVPTPTYVPYAVGVGLQFDLYFLSREDVVGERAEPLMIEGPVPLKMR